MKDLRKYKGIIPALYAAYDEEGNVSPERVQALAKHYLEIGVKGLYVGGSSGECIYQTLEERKIVLENVMKAVGGKMTVIAHIAAPSTHQSIELAQHAKSLKVDALAAIPPQYYGLTDQAVEKYWTDIIEATDMDFFIYNIPSTTGFSLSPEIYEHLLSYPQVVGVKNSSMSVMDLYHLRIVQSRETIIFSGVDEQYLAGRSMGADGGIGSTFGVMPTLYMKIDELIKNRDLNKARELQYTINEIIFKIVNCEGSLYDIMKKVLKINEGIDAGSVRNPLPKVTDADTETIKEVASLIKKAEEKYVG